MMYHVLFLFLPTVNRKLNETIVFCFYLVLKDDFTHFEPSQSLGGAKDGDPPEKPSDHPQAEHGMSNM